MSACRRASDLKARLDRVLEPRASARFLSADSLCPLACGSCPPVETVEDSRERARALCSARLFLT